MILSLPVRDRSLALWSALCGVAPVFSAHSLYWVRQATPCPLRQETILQKLRVRCKATTTYGSIPTATMCTQNLNSKIFEKIGTRSCGPIFIMNLAHAPTLLISTKSSRKYLEWACALSASGSIGILLIISRLCLSLPSSFRNNLIIAPATIANDPHGSVLDVKS